MTQSDFDLNTHPPPRVFTKEEIAAKLRDCIKISKENYETLEYNTQVRYYKKNGDFKAGGYVLSNPKLPKKGE